MVFVFSTLQPNRIEWCWLTAETTQVRITLSEFLRRHCIIYILSLHMIIFIMLIRFKYRNENDSGCMCVFLLSLIKYLSPDSYDTQHHHRPFELVSILLVCVCVHFQFTYFIFQFPLFPYLFAVSLLITNYNIPIPFSSLFI